MDDLWPFHHSGGEAVSAFKREDYNYHPYISLFLILFTLALVIGGCQLLVDLNL